MKNLRFLPVLLNPVSFESTREGHFSGTRGVKVGLKKLVSALPDAGNRRILRSLVLSEY